MHLIPVSITARQASKLRKGHPVRIKKGSGFNLIVSPTNYRLATRAFAKNKGLELKLTPEELEANRSLSPEQHAQMAKEASASALFGELPMAGTGLFAGGDIWSKLGDKAIDVGFDIMRKKLGLGLFASPGGGGLIEDLNSKLGTNMGYLGRAGKVNELANRALSEMSDRGFDLKKSVEPIKHYWDELNAPPSRGTGIRKHMMTDSIHSGRRSTGMISGRGTLHSSDVHLPPALVSQPYGANFHMQFQLPPQYHKFNSGTDEI